MAFILKVWSIKYLLTTYPERRDETILHFGDPFLRDRLQYMQRANEVIRKLKHGYECKPGRKSEVLGVFDLVTVIKTGYIEEEKQSVEPDHLIRSLQMCLPEYPVTKQTITFNGKDYTIVCIEI